MRVFPRVPLKEHLSLQRSIDIHCANVALLGQEMGQYGNVLTMKKIKNAVLHSPLLCSQFVDSITKNVRLWPPQFVTCFLESLYPHHALCERLFVRSTKGDQPIQNRCRSIEIPKKDDMCFRHSNPHDYSIFAILFKPADSPCIMFESGFRNVAQAIFAQEYTPVHPRTSRYPAGFRPVAFLGGNPGREAILRSSSNARAG